MRERLPPVTASDLELLDALARQGSLVGAARSVGMSRDRANYRLGVLGRALGGPIAEGRRGGRRQGGTRLTARGERLRRSAPRALELVGRASAARSVRGNVLVGRYRSGPPPVVAVGPGLSLAVAFEAREGERVRLALDPESILLAPQRFPSSARNVLAARVVRLLPARASGSRSVEVAVGRWRLAVAVTDATVGALGLRPGRRLYLYAKATALRPLAPATLVSRRR